MTPFVDGMVLGFLLGAWFIGVPCILLVMWLNPFHRSQRDRVVSPTLGLSKAPAIARRQERIEKQQAIHAKREGKPDIRIISPSKKAKAALFSEIDAGSAL